MEAAVFFGTVFSTLKTKWFQNDAFSKGSNFETVPESLQSNSAFCRFSVVDRRFAVLVWLIGENVLKRCVLKR